MYNLDQESKKSKILRWKTNAILLMCFIILLELTAVFGSLNQINRNVKYAAQECHVNINEQKQFNKERK